MSSINVLRTLSLTLFISLFSTVSVKAVDVLPDGNEQLLIQQQRQKALEQQLAPSSPDINLSQSVSVSGKITFPNEKPCFPITVVTLENRGNVPLWIPLQRIANQAKGHCLGSKSINLLMGVLQNRLVDHGFVTSRVLAPAQDLKSGTLVLTLIAGNIRHVRLSPDSNRYVTLYTAFPPHDGNLLDLRDIEQGLENLQRLPTVQASMEIVPGEQPGESDIVLNRRQSRFWRVGMSVDNSGTRSTGRYLGGMTLSLDNPFSLSDLFYLSGTHDINKQRGLGSKNLTGHYSVPFSYGLFSLNANDYVYHQTVAGSSSDYRYSGRSRNIGAQISRVLHRNGMQKTSVSYDVNVRESQNFINDTEIGVQRRLTSSWKLGLQHRHYFKWMTIDAGASYQRGTRWFGARPAPEEYWGEATALSKIIQLTLQMDTPFRLLGQNFHYNLQYQRQMTNTLLTPQDQFSLGGRWSVRGFDGERSLSADRGWYVRNDIGWYTPLQGQEIYSGIDYGEIGGRGSGELESVGRHLSGGVIGLRGSVLNTGYDLFAGVPFSKPDGFQTSPITFGFSLNWSY